MVRSSTIMAEDLLSGQKTERRVLAASPTSRMVFISAELMESLLIPEWEESGSETDEIRPLF